MNEGLCVACSGGGGGDFLSMYSKALILASIVLLIIIAIIVKYYNDYLQKMADADMERIMREKPPMNWTPHGYVKKTEDDAEEDENSSGYAYKDIKWGESSQDVKESGLMHSNYGRARIEALFKQMRVKGRNFLRLQDMNSMFSEAGEVEALHDFIDENDDGKISPAEWKNFWYQIEMKSGPVAATEMMDRLELMAARTKGGQVPHLIQARVKHMADQDRHDLADKKLRNLQKEAGLSTGIDAKGLIGAIQGQFLAEQAAQLDGEDVMGQQVSDLLGRINEQAVNLGGDMVDPADFASSGNAPSDGLNSILNQLFEDVDIFGGDDGGGGGGDSSAAEIADAVAREAGDADGDFFEVISDACSSLNETIGEYCSSCGELFEDFGDTLGDFGEIGATAFEMLGAELSELMAQLKAPMKILAGHLQILSSMEFSLDISWPPIFTSFSMNMNFINLNMFEIIPAGCIVTPNYYMKFSFTVIAPMVLLFFGIAWVKYNVTSLRLQGNSSAAKSAVDNGWLVFFFISYLIYPAVAAEILAMFACEKIGDDHYLRTDLRLTCTDETYTYYMLAGVACVFIYILGIPLFYFVILFRNQHRFHLEEVHDQIGFLYDQYETEDGKWIYEIVELFRKLILTGTIIFFMPDSISQIAIALLFSGFFLCVHLCMQAFASDDDDFLQSSSMITATCTMFLGLLIKATTLEPEAAATGLGEDVLGYLLIALQMGVMVISLYCAIVIKLYPQLRSFRHKLKTVMDTVKDHGIAKNGGGSLLAAAAAAQYEDELVQKYGIRFKGDHKDDLDAIEAALKVLGEQEPSSPDMVGKGLHHKELKHTPVEIVAHVDSELEVLAHEAQEFNRPRPKTSDSNVTIVSGLTSFLPSTGSVSLGSRVSAPPPPMEVSGSMLSAVPLGHRVAAPPTMMAVPDDGQDPGTTNDTQI